MYLMIIQIKIDHMINWCNYLCILLCKVRISFKNVVVTHLNGLAKSNPARNNVSQYGHEFLE